MPNSNQSINQSTAERVTHLHTFIPTPYVPTPQCSDTPKNCGQVNKCSDTPIFLHPNVPIPLRIVDKSINVCRSESVPTRPAISAVFYYCCYDYGPIKSLWLWGVPIGKHLNTCPSSLVLRVKFNTKRPQMKWLWDFTQVQKGIPSIPLGY